MRLRRYEIQPNVRERFIMAALDCAEAAARSARDGADAEGTRMFAEASKTLLDMGELYIDPVEVDVLGR